MLTFEEFQDLAVRVSKKVNLFDYVWRIDPTAEFFGGTAREYCYWLRSQFRGLSTRKEVDAKIEELLKTPLIDARPFILEDSDIDLVAKAKGLEDLTKIFRVKRAEYANRDRFDSNTPIGKNELLQGHLPVEKIRFGKQGFLEWPGLGGGLREIFEGKPTARYAPQEVFDKTFYASRGLNHPILLALRYIRVLAMNYYYLHGKEFPEESKLFSIDEESMQQTKAIIEAALSDRQLSGLLEDEKFREWANNSLRKSYLGHTNPTATVRLTEFFHLDALIARYDKYFDAPNQLLFAKPPLSEEVIAKRLAAYSLKPEDVFVDLRTLLPELKLYHGVKSDGPALRSILLLGVSPSVSGSAGFGLYGVGVGSLAFAKRHAGHSDRIVAFTVNPNARAMDLTRKKALKLLKKFKWKWDEFANFFGVQVLKYPYEWADEAFVVKDGAVLGKAEALNQQITSIFEMLQQVQNLQTAYEAMKLISSWQGGVTPLDGQVLIPRLIDPWFGGLGGSIQSFDEAFKFLRSPLLTKLPSEGYRALIEQISIVRLSENSVETFSVEDAYKVLSDLEALKFDEVAQSNFRRIVLIPKLRAMAGKVSTWADLFEFLPKFESHHLTVEERATILSASPLFEGQSGTKSVHLFKVASSQIDSHGLGASQWVRQLVLALYLKAHLNLSEGELKRTEESALAHQKFDEALRELFGPEHLEAVGSHFRLAGDFLENVVKAYPESPELQKALFRSLKEGMKWKRNQGIYQYWWMSLDVGLAGLTVGASALGWAIWILLFKEDPVEGLKAYFAVNKVIVSPLLAVSLIRLHFYRSAVKIPMAYLARRYSQASGFKCGTYLRLMASPFRFRESQGTTVRTLPQSPLGTYPGTRITWQ